jgi:uncharacterized protein
MHSAYFSLKRCGRRHCGTIASMKLALFVVLAAVATLYAAAMAWLWLYQEKLLFQPSVLAANYPLATQPGLSEVKVNVPGAQLSGLHLQLSQPKGVVFFLHGNGGNADSWFTNPDFYRRANFDVVMMDYRGYGKSTGQIESEAQLRADVRAVWQHFAPQYQSKKWVLLGRSLGTALAAGLSVELAQAGRAPDVTILVCAYQSMQAIAATHYPIVPQALLRYPLRTHEAVAQMRSPLILIHGEADTLIAPNHSRVLHQLAPTSKLVLVPKAGHNDLQEFEVYLQTLRAGLDAS